MYIQGRVEACAPRFHTGCPSSQDLRMQPYLESVSTEVIKLKLSHWEELGSDDWKFGDRLPGECHVKMKAEVGVMLLPAKETRDGQQPREVEWGIEQLLPRRVRRNQPCDTVT